VSWCLHVKNTGFNVQKKYRFEVVIFFPLLFFISFFCFLITLCKNHLFFNKSPVGGAPPPVIIKKKKHRRYFISANKTSKVVGVHVRGMLDDPLGTCDLNGHEFGLKIIFIMCYGFSNR